MLDVVSGAMHLALLLELAGEPVKTLEETVTGGGASGLDVLFIMLEKALPIVKFYRGIQSYPSALPQAVKAKLVCNLSDAHRVLLKQVSQIEPVKYFQAAVKLTGRSCLLAKTRRRASRSSSSLSMR